MFFSFFTEWRTISSKTKNSKKLQIKGGYLRYIKKLDKNPE
ncbi:hypothetical protein BREVNS_0768 [Brevinematales bacterium NS]|nr:hypothetical protein BREVNS_0768 [Brevinematales bacterium NS]